MPLCDACKKREAFYLRTYSGEKLCLPCLERSLAKAVRKALAKPGLLKPRIRILVPLSLSKPSYSLALTKILTRVEKSYGSTVLLAIPANIYDTNTLPRVDAEPVYLDLHIKPGLPTSPVSCTRLERRWALETAKKTGADAVVLPLTRTDLNLLLLHSLLEEGIEALSEAAPWLHTGPDEPRIVSGLWTLEAEAVAAYAFAKKLLVEPACKPQAITSKDVFYSIAGRRPELEFSSLKSLELLLASARASLKTCPLCKGFTRQPGACKYCRRLDIAVNPQSYS